MAGKVFKNTLRGQKHEHSGDFLNYGYRKTVPKNITKMSDYNYRAEFSKVGTAALRFNRYLSGFRKMQVVVAVTCACKKTAWKITAEPRFGIAEKSFDYELIFEN